MIEWGTQEEKLTRQRAWLCLPDSTTILETCNVFYLKASYAFILSWLVDPSQSCPIAFWQHDSQGLVLPGHALVKYNYTAI